MSDKAEKILVWGEAAAILIVLGLIDGWSHFKAGMAPLGHLFAEKWFDIVLALFGTWLGYLLARRHIEHLMSKIVKTLDTKYLNLFRERAFHKAVSEMLTCYGSAGAGIADQERSGDGRGRCDRELRSHAVSNLGTNGFTLKLGSFGNFSVRHKPGILRKIPFTGETLLTKDRRKVRFVSLGALRQCERVIPLLSMQIDFPDTSG
jgi:hypothetical protein